MVSVELWTDGSCLKNPGGPGGWAFVLLEASGQRIESSGGDRETTSNRMELTAVLEGLRATDAGTLVVVTDSEYVQKAFTQGWLAKWVRNDWHTSGKGKPAVKNRDLWEALLRESAGRQITWRHVRGHNGHAENERADHLAYEAAAAVEARISDGF